ncbi:MULTISPECIES: flagellar biosynthetic protein FliQ [Paracoccus]|jgi:flagellar biosynthetic protein FliQ|uniref:Flagellar biosynthetic protein FliQ n=2 Tax=Paracoccus TaxID=265 RepID=A0A5C4R9Q9_9RHOB|nr:MULTISPECIES: flagellar biosynthetic protein FliQ [Paracoccus]TYP67579.1 flagellar biosynthetic protein FliQ [Stutzerimonas stutzeri]AZY92846.1 flagellar biosynthetic protein FliQ [Paracoccus sp. Arc7-R13]KIX17699.1 flagellar biosynthesis protein FliQ [Paracoccus sp. 228]KJZ32819.1 flagellar biosynthesis protein FliQ [Paracoccus sp. S4493]MBF5079344.1 flagellar biosynthetic protein FliQ [Paracoccus sp. NBH48]|tara:strand:- start:895 stop:1161 length:267 start_codon:yes stop_codon:yes gene_type:complete
MGETVLFDMLRQALLISVRISAPLLGVALIAGVVIGLFQALTSVQEMTLTFVPKVGLMLVVFWVSMSFMTTALADFYLGEIIPMIAGS